MNMLKAFLILFIFSKKKLLCLLIIWIVLLVTMSFNSALILVISFLLHALGFVVVPPNLVASGLCYLFEICLYFIGVTELYL